MSREQDQKAQPLAYESKEMLALTAYMGLQSRGEPIGAHDDPRLKPFIDKGRAAFNQRHDMRGHVQATRYGSRRIDDDAELMHVFRYVARNPVEAGLCADPADWPWSSYASTIGKTEPIQFVDPSRIINCFGDTPEQAIAALRDYVERGADS